MNLLQFYQQSQFTRLFNHTDIKGVITVDDFSFDIRLVNNILYCNSLPLEDFLNEAMLTVEEELRYEEAIYNWLINCQAA